MQFTTTTLTYLTRWLTSYSFELLHLNFVLYVVLEKDT